MLTLSDLETGFREIGLFPGMFLEVHSSLSSFGNVQGGADTINDALQKIITSQGAIIMPSFPMTKPLPLTEEDKARGITYKIRMLDPLADEPSGMGIVADTFRRRTDVQTGEGLFRVSAWGAEQEANSQGFTNLHEHDGHALLLGVDIYRLTSMHYVESILPQAVRAYGNPSPEIQALYPKVDWYVQTRDTPILGWYTIQDQAFQRGYITEMRIGQARCLFFKVNSVIGLYREALQQDPFGLFGLSEPA